ncbi:hypothetical protein JOM56_010423 [Amanita muscaria]
MSETISKLDLSKVGRTNLYHSDEEGRLIDEAICRIKEALQRVQEDKRALILREKALRSDLDRYLSARAPIKCLPDNVLCNIFELLCQDELLAAIPLLWIPPQITISHVCSAWRQLMLDTPAFWCSIRLESDSVMKIKEVDIAHAWLSRAKSLPCSVEIIFENGWSEADEYQDWRKNIVKDIVSLFKLKKFDLTFPDYHLQDLLQFPDEKLRCIEDLCLRRLDLKDSTNSETKLHKLPSLISFSLFGPRLETSRLFGVAPEDDSRLASIPWHQLRHIKIHRMFPILFCLTMLELSSSALETCSLEVYVDSSFMSSPPSTLKEPLQCSQLREFKVDIHSPSVTDSESMPEDIIDPFLGSLRCPKIKSLTVGPIDQFAARFNILPRSINLQTFLRMQHVSGMHLEELIICNTARDLEVLPLLASFPSLRRLVLPPTINFTEEAMDKLGSGSIAPFLEDLTIEKPVPVLERLFQMIKTRSSIGKEDNTRKYKPTPFKYVILHCEGLARKEYTNTIREINQSGVSLNVNWGSYGSDESDDELITHDPWDIYIDEDYDEDMSDIYEW